MAPLVTGRTKQQFAQYLLQCSQCFVNVHCHTLGLHKTSQISLLMLQLFLHVNISEQSGCATDRKKKIVGLGTANFLKELHCFLQHIQSGPILSSHCDQWKRLKFLYLNFNEMFTAVQAHILCMSTLRSIGLGGSSM